MIEIRSCTSTLFLSFIPVRCLKRPLQLVPVAGPVPRRNRLLQRQRLEVLLRLRMAGVWMLVAPVDEHVVPILLHIHNSAADAVPTVSNSPRWPPPFTTTSPDDGGARRRAIQKSDPSGFCGVASTTPFSTTCSADRRKSLLVLAARKRVKKTFTVGGPICS